MNITSTYRQTWCPHYRMSIVCMNKIALLIRAHVDDWPAVKTIIASNVLPKQLGFSQMHTIGNIAIIFNFVFLCHWSFPLYLLQLMLVNVK